MYSLAYTKDLDRDFLLKNTRNIMALFKRWELTNPQQIELLGEISPAQLDKFKNGTACISGRDTIERVGNLLGIHKSLRILFPRNREVVYKWVKARNKKLHNLSPLEVMLEYGYLGIAQVRRYTDHMRGI